MTAFDRSIFYKVATKEDDYTQILCNLIKRTEGEAFRTEVLSLLLDDRTLASQIPAKHIITQMVVEGVGRPDLVIDHAPKVLAITEVKLNPRRGCTDYQTPADDGTLNGYFEFLSRTPADRKILTFLVPGNWKLLGKMRDELKQFGLTNQSIKTKVVLWEDIFGLSGRFSRDPLHREFWRLLDNDFSPLMFITAEVDMAINGGSSPISTIIKAAYMVDEIAKKCKGSKYLFAGPQADKAGEAYGLDFIRKVIGREGGKELFFWFGIWSPYWENHGKALCFGVKDSWKAEKKAFLDVYSGRTQGFTNPDDESDAWTLGWFPEVQADLIDLDPVTKLWERLEPILNGVCAAGESST